MIRLLLRLLNIRDYEVCASCQTLKEQLEYERSEKKQLTETLLNIIHPKVVEQPVVELSPIQQTSGLFSRKRAVLEQRDREEAKILRQSKNLGVPDNIKVSEVSTKIEELEHELGIEEKTS